MIAYDAKAHEQKLIDHLKIYPNPVQNGFLYIQANNTGEIKEDLKWRTSDLTGRICYEQHHVRNEEAINISQLTSGYYLLELLGQSSHYLGKTVVQNK